MTIEEVERIFPLSSQREWLPVIIHTENRPNGFRGMVYWNGKKPDFASFGSEIPYSDVTRFEIMENWNDRDKRYY